MRTNASRNESRVTPGMVVPSQAAEPTLTRHSKDESQSSVPIPDNVGLEPTKKQV